MKRGSKAALVAVAAMTVMSAGMAFAAQDKITICHATSSQSNPYVAQDPAKNGDVSGHADHTGPVWPAADWGDIIPPFTFDGGSFPGLNWTAEGQALYENDCQTPGESPDPTPVVTQSPTDTVTSGAAPADGAWLLVAALGALLASVVVLTPARAKSRR